MIHVCTWIEKQKRSKAACNRGFAMMPRSQMYNNILHFTAHHQHQKQTANGIITIIAH